MEQREIGTFHPGYLIHNENRFDIIGVMFFLVANILYNKKFVSKSYFEFVNLLYRKKIFNLNRNQFQVLPNIWKDLLIQ